VITFTTPLNKTAELCTNVQNSPTVSSFLELNFKSDHIGRCDLTRQNSFVELDRVGRCDRLKDSTQQICFVELSRVGRCDRGFRVKVVKASSLNSGSSLHNGF